nr:PaRep2a protein [Pyrobaculum aerophilum]
MASLKDLYRGCFGQLVLLGEESKVIRRLELYYGICEMAKTHWRSVAKNMQNR